WIAALAARGREVRMPRATAAAQLATGRGGARRLAVRGNRKPRDFHPHDGIGVALVLRGLVERSLLAAEEPRQVRPMRAFHVAGPEVVGLHHVQVAVEDQIAIARHVTPPARAQVIANVALLDVLRPSGSQTFTFTSFELTARFRRSRSAKEVKVKV